MGRQVCGGVGLKGSTCESAVLESKACSVDQRRGSPTIPAGCRWILFSFTVVAVAAAAYQLGCRAGASETLRGDDDRPQRRNAGEHVSFACRLKQQPRAVPWPSREMGPWVARSEGGDNVVCPVLPAPSGSLTPGLVSKMNVLAGLNSTFGISHNRGLHLGNYAANDGNGSSGKAEQAFPTPTTDQVMGWSPSFYPSLNGSKGRVMVMGARPGYSYNWSKAQAKSGSIQEIGTVSSPQQMFDRIFVPGAPTNSATPAAPKRATIVDRVLENYKRLRNGNARLSKQDRQRLDDHMSRLSELDRKVNTMSASTIKECGQQTKPASNSSGLSSFSLMNDVFVAAFVCGSSRIGTMSITTPLVQFSGSWHQDVAHKGFDAGPQALLVGHNQKVFSGSFLDLARKLDAVDLGGHTLLDDTMIAWTQESAASTHDTYNVPIVTMGSAAGAFKTGGMHCDYRFISPKSEWPYVRGKGLYTGLPWNQYLGGVLVAMGLPRSEFETASSKGYGHFSEDAEVRVQHSPASLGGAGNPLPFIVV